MSGMITVERRILQAVDKIMACGTPIPMDQTWFELGVNSIDYIKIMVEIENELDVEIDDERLAYGPSELIGDFRDYVVSLIKGESGHETD